MKKALIVCVISLGLLAGCKHGAEVNQSKLCHASSDAEAMQCKAGELMYFAPNFFGNEQLPLNIAGAYCDFNHQVMHTTGGVLCVLTDKRLSLIGG
ncbi:MULTISPECIES: hypothetical protein [unclassified Oleiphilus]|uniref:hypothetical protein n=1 Tax=unclassified Oleiphilus TaxID=2631174 RepID=UPI0007C34474|nr:MULTISPECIES: hypothetical protein [unclassified Oleiphilus]KZY42801.1 hypothetical protein A3732_15665 [Oleiphilus sp. HI0050]KZY75753.1 hypothetical protein A3740_14540 [Oleiphilus sp. HI0068]KZY80137.1 hypothetical protein A3741_05945 [Oleiphilus sp. HI0069]KZZ30771.1 hypothetical protein A3755_13230 [Oleiphilus sp. HI0085]KZZ31957.1 hypothetical protein A3756_06300 [Oleiphilus sp. HI0086]